MSKCPQCGWVDPSKWHRWFAWYPVEVPGPCQHKAFHIWWTWVERRGIPCPPMDWYWEYRPLEEEKP